MASGKVDPGKAPPHYWTRSQAERLIAAEPDAGRRLFLLAGWRTGARLAELLALEWRDIDLDEGQMTIRRGKGHRYRVVPLHPELATALSWARGKARRDAPVFAFSRRTAARIVKAAVATAGLEWNTDRVYAPGPHSLRHSAIRHWLASGIPVNRVAQWAGHSSPTVTLNTYAPLAPDSTGSMAGVS